MPGAHGGCEAREREDDEERMLRFASKSVSRQRDKLAHLCPQHQHMFVLSC